MVIICAGYVHKKYSSPTEAQHYARLFRDFPHHVVGFAQNSEVIYPFFEGTELEQLIEMGNSLDVTMTGLGDLLGRIHTNSEQVDDYDLICEKRGYTSGVFLPSRGYFGNIHGDLNTTNILVNNQEIKFIDRFSEKGDILFEFPFVLSFLCRGDEVSLNATRTFFDAYLLHVEDPYNFGIAFRNNFINFGIWAAQNYEKFPEWKHGLKLSEEIRKHETIQSFLDMF